MAFAAVVSLVATTNRRSVPAYRTEASAVTRFSRKPRRYVRSATVSPARTDLPNHLFGDVVHLLQLGGLLSLVGRLAGDLKRRSAQAQIALRRGTEPA